ncbi:Rv1355c family protein [Mycolicibacterium sediminis]|uniref:THIF-type NAD/FAD binding fold domain-containing protein n=1 Tax=Mycolicibacterium sediminis TaxID=1286180 RepID=A0A7I7QRQ9_9MYCO|nr:Rv1355c family protein [Mycolicibacterium sediminis]BBY29089.1 hypothetical protein MSEDJ_31850 [Mycolicibacterium sediminis]
MSRRSDDLGFSAVLLDTSDDADGAALDRLRSDPTIEALDSFAAQHAAIADMTDDAGLLGEAPRWAYYPWRRSIVKILGPQSFRRLRLDRNRNLITAGEQDHLGTLVVGVIGLSSGHVIAHTLAAEGLCGELRLADFDELELSNLNRVPASVFDLGVNKAVATARRIAELDPYLTVHPWPSGVTADTVDAFLDGMDVVVEECDSLDVKALVREESRRRRLPVVMATSDRGLIDVERFDLDPHRPLFHGLLGDVDVAELATLSSQQKVPQVMRLVDVAGLTARAAASLLEVGHELATWPQLAGDVTLGAGGVAEAVRRIGLGLALGSGRARLDAGAALDRLEEPVVVVTHDPADPAEPAPPTSPLAAIVAAAHRAPSGGNSQPWAIEADGDTVEIVLTPELTSTMDVGFRGSAVAVGAAVFNAEVAAAASGDVVARVRYSEPDERWPLKATITLEPGTDPDRARLYPAVLRRETNRHRGDATALSGAIVGALTDAAVREGAGLRMLSSPAEIAAAAEILGAADRIRYLTPPLHAEMASELRWPGNDSLQSGIDVRSLELDPGTLLALDILKRPEVMETLASWDGGRILGADTSSRVQSSSALAVVTVDGARLSDYARGGAAVEAVWVTAEEFDLSVQPISPAFLYARSDGDLREVSATHVDALADLRRRFAELAGLADEVPALILRFAVTPPTSVRSRRRHVNIDDQRYSEFDVRSDAARKP